MKLKGDKSKIHVNIKNGETNDPFVLTAYLMTYVKSLKFLFREIAVLL